MKNYAVKWVLGLTVLLVGLFSIPSAFATNIAVSPPTLSFSVENGSSFMGELTVYGSDSQDLRVQVSLRDWVLNQEGRAAQPEEGFQRSAASWVEIEPRDLIVPAGEERVIKVSGVAPVDLSPGDYWTGFFIEFKPLYLMETTGVVVVPAIWGSITITLTGQVERKGRITGLKVGWNKEKSRTGGVKGKIAFVNESAVILKPVGQVEIRDLSGETVMELPVPSVKVLPDTKREIPFEGEFFLKDGDYLVLAILDYGGKRKVAAQTMLKVGFD